jgi:glycosyltransferase involved in cell wall biosynthesis
MRPTLVHVATSDVSLEHLLGPQLQRFVEAGYDVVGASAPGPHVEALCARGVRHVSLPSMSRAMTPTRDVRALRELVRCFRRVRPTIVHAHTPKACLYGQLAARLTRVPVIVNTVHGLYALPEDRLRKRVPVYGFERLSAALAHHVLLVSPEDVHVLRRLRVPAAKMTVLSNGVDLARFDPSAVDPADAQSARREMGAQAPTDVVVGLVGRLVREKGYPEMFEAACLLRDHAPDVRVAVIGWDDPEKPDALTAEDRAIARDAGVRFLGGRDDVVRLYSGMDVYVLASHREGYPRSAMEAAAMGLPIVATNIRGCRQVVENGVTGVLVPPRDPVALAGAIASLANDEHRRREMACAAARRARMMFDEQRSVDITLETYAQLLTRAGIAVPQAAAP